MEARHLVREQYRDDLEEAVSHESRQRLVSAMGRNALAITAELINKEPGKYDNLKGDQSYNSMLSRLPGLAEGSRRLREHDGSPKDAKRLIIPFNHALKNLIDEHSSLSPAQLTGVLESTFFEHEYSRELFQDVNRNILPGMLHELAGGTNLYYLPGAPEVLDTSVENELRGWDAILSYEDGTVITLDFKKDPRKAARKQAERLAWRSEHGITQPDNHLIVASGYRDEDFLADRVGRVTPEARLREQVRYDALIEGKHQELLASRMSIDNSSKMY